MLVAAWTVVAVCAVVLVSWLVRDRLDVVRYELWRLRERRRERRAHGEDVVYATLVEEFGGVGGSSPDREEAEALMRRARPSSRPAS